MDGIKISQGLGLQDFDLIRVIGRGSYAKVLLVRLKKNDQMYAMKVVKKELVHDDEVRRPGPRLLCGALGLLALPPFKGSKTQNSPFQPLSSIHLWALGACTGSRLLPATSFRAVSTPQKETPRPSAVPAQPPRPAPATPGPRPLSGLPFSRHFV